MSFKVGAMETNSFKDTLSFVIQANPLEYVSTIFFEDSSSLINVMVTYFKYVKTVDRILTNSLVNIQ